MKKSVWSSWVLILSLLWPLSLVQAQEQQPDGPVYIVQPGDTLWGIAQRFGVSVDDLVTENGMTDPSQVSVGARLVIPGLEGIEGVLVTETVSFGENLESLSRRYQIPLEYLIRLNHYTSPGDAYAGSTLIVPEKETNATPSERGRVTLKPGQSLFELALAQQINPWALLTQNQLESSRAVLPGDTLYRTSQQQEGEQQEESQPPGALPAAISAAALEPFPLVQGRTLVIQLQAPAGASLTGQFHDRSLNFFSPQEGDYVALQGIHAMLEPGLYPLTLEGELADGTPLRFSQQVYIESGDYAFDPPLVVDSETMDAHTNEDENQLWASLSESVTPERYWRSEFESPVEAYFSECFPSLFGNRRSYNESGYTYFHSGLDFCGGVGNDIYAPAPGEIVFVQELTVRGHATLIDHGWGVYSAYAHQSETLVAEGDWVETGDLIGNVGETGRVTGPHLHWEIIVGGVQVDPLQWLDRTFP